MQTKTVNATTGRTTNERIKIPMSTTASTFEITSDNCKASKSDAFKNHYEQTKTCKVNRSLFRKNTIVTKKSSTGNKKDSDSYVLLVHEPTGFISIPVAEGQFGFNWGKIITHPKYQSRLRALQTQYGVWFSDLVYCEQTDAGVLPLYAHPAVITSMIRFNERVLNRKNAKFAKTKSKIPHLKDTLTVKKKYALANPKYNPRDWSSYSAVKDKEARVAQTNTNKARTRIKNKKTNMASQAKSANMQSTLKQTSLTLTSLVAKVNNIEKNLDNLQSRFEQHFKTIETMVEKAQTMMRPNQSVPADTARNLPIHSLVSDIELSYDYTDN